MTIETKFNVGDKVWFKSADKIESGIVVEYHAPTQGYNIELEDCYVFLNECDLYKTKQELLDSL